MTKCYMCEKAGTTAEHVPPRCLFPEKKDLAEDVDLRKNLITVKSCIDHNSSKSKEDEYLLYCLCMGITSNDTGIQQFKTKILRAITNNPLLFQQLMITKESIIVQDLENSRVDKSIGVTVDLDRLHNIYTHIGYGLYKHIKKVNWDKTISVHIEFLIHNDEENSVELNSEISEISEAMDIIFVNSIFIGDNPRVFKYQYLQHEENFIIRMYFYGDSKVTLFFCNDVPCKDQC